VDLEVTQGEPESAAGLEGGGFVYFEQAKNAAVEGSGGVFLSVGYGDLGVVEAKEARGRRHGSQLITLKFFPISQLYEGAEHLFDFLSEICFVVL
jgi:hypothetical protein